ncbi:7377_t:CDS:1, partial [Entrophospora sp. SA101]
LILSRNTVPTKSFVVVVIVVTNVSTAGDGGDYGLSKCKEVKI